MQKFAANYPYEFPNGAVGWRPGGEFDCVGPFAKVNNCPVAGTELRLTVYATGYADSFFSMPAATRYRGKYIGGFFCMTSDGDVSFVPYDRFRARLGA